MNKKSTIGALTIAIMLGFMSVALVAGMAAPATAAYIDSVTVGPQVGTLTNGTAGSVTYLINVTRAESTAAFTATLSITTTLPTGVSYSFSPNPVSFAANQPYNTSTLTITTTGTTPGGTTSFTVKALKGGSDSKTGNGTLTVNNPVPTTLSISPNSKNVGDAAFPMIVTGTNFVSGSIVRFDGSDRLTTYVSSTSLTVSIPASDMTAAGIHSITVFNPTPGGGTSNSQTFTVNKAIPIITWSNPADIIYGTALSGTQLDATASVPGTFVYTPPAGTVLSVGDGQTLHVDFTPTDSTNYTVASKDVTINVIAASKIDQTITFDPLSDKIYGDAPFDVSAMASSGLPVSFSIVSGPATISGSTITITGTGIVTVRASQAGNDIYNAAPDVDQTFTVNKATPTITWSNPADIIYGTALSETQLNATASVPGTYVYTPPAGTVLSAGADQTLHVDFTPADSTNYTVASKDVTINVSKATPIITWSNPADITYGTSLNGIQLNAVASVPGSLIYTPVSGTVLSAGTQILHVDLTPTDSVNYTTASKDVTINVVKATPTITWSNPTDITYGTALSETQLNSVASVPGTYIYTPPAGTVLSAGADQTLHVDFTPTDSTNYTVASKDVTINITKATPIITWSNPADITYGTSLNGIQLNAVASVPGTFVYTPPAGTVLSVGDGQTLHVDFTPTDTANYSSASKDVTINVSGTLPLVRYINGTVRDSLTHDTLVGVIVSTIGATAITDGSGKYSLAVDSGTYPLTATYDIRYYTNNSVSVSTVSSAVVMQDIELVLKPTGNITGSVIHA